MIKFVVSRPVRKIKRSAFRGDPQTRFRNQKQKRFPLKNVRIVFGIFVLIYGSFLLLKDTLFAPEYTITIVRYNSGDVAKYGDPYLYKMISSSLKKENYNIARFSKNAILANVQAQYPFVKDLTINFIWSNAAKVDITFADVDLIIRNYNLKFGVVNGQIFPLYSGDSLGKGVEIVDMPWYLSGQAAMTGLFYRQSASGLVEQVALLYQGFPGLNHIEYLPGGERSIVFINGTMVYINNLADIPTQIKNYDLLKKYYPSFSQLKEIDLWSIELDKLIVKK